MSGVRNRISKNMVFENAGRGIDLNNDSFTINGPGDSDIGANGLQDYPFVVGVEFTAGSKTIHWNLDSTPASTFRIEFFSNLFPDPSGFGEGEKFLNGIDVVTDLTGTARFSTTHSLGELFISATATDVLGNTSEFSMVDTDGDALADAWESAVFSNNTLDINGDAVISGVIDVNEDGVPDLELPAASAFSKDVFIEVDAMDSLLLTSVTLDDVVGAYAKAPANLVNNPDGSLGVDLHIDVSDTNLPYLPFAFNFSQFDLYKSVFFGTPSNRAARGLAYRYAVLVAELKDSAGGLTQNASFFGSTDGILFTANSLGFVGKDERAAFMHELGHSLALDHGGPLGDTINFKPNYHSIMNYLWSYDFPWTREDQNGNGAQDPGEVNRIGKEWKDTDTAWRLDYSTRAFNTLDESNLDESAGIGGDPTSWVLYGPQTSFPNVVPESGPVDWSLDDDDGDGDLDNDRGIVADLNPLDPDGAPGQVLPGEEDWSHLKYYFLESTVFQEPKLLEPDGAISVDLYDQLSAIGDTPGMFQFSEGVSNVSERDGFIIVNVARAAGTHGTVTVDFATADDTALAGIDYTSTSGTLTFAEGEFRKSFTVPILNDSIAEGRKSFQTVLRNPAVGTTVHPTKGVFRITVNDDDGLQFADTFFEVREDATSATITVSRTDTQTAATVKFRAEDLGATAGSDYQAVSGVLTFGVGQLTSTFSVPILDDSLIEGLEVVRLVLSDPSGGALGSVSQAFLSIRDVESGVVEVSQAVQKIDESAGTAKITVFRTNGTNGEIAVKFRTADGSAVAGADYTSNSGTLTFADGETTKTITVSIANDAEAEPTETFSIILSDPTNGAVLGTIKTAELRIADDEPSAFAFSAPTFDASEAAGTATIEVVRLGVSNGSASVDYATTDGTARAGSDYVAGASTLTFADGESSKSITVSLIDDKLGEGVKTFRVILQNPSAGTQIESPGTATLRILDDETVNGATFVVTNTNDSGAGSLRQAIFDANARVGTDLITFNIPGAGVRTIRPLTPLPTVSSPVTIDGYSQPGSSVNTLSSGDNAVLLVELDNSGTAFAADGAISIRAGNSIVRGLVINRSARSGILMDFGGGNLIAGNFIGTDATGQIGLGGGSISIGGSDFGGSSGNVVGGVTPELRNVISNLAIVSGSRAGATSKSRGNFVLGNYVGVAADGHTPLGTGGGILVSTEDRGGPGLAPGNTIGGIEPGAGNIIAFGGVIVSSGYGNSIRGNSIYLNGPPQVVLTHRNLGISLAAAASPSPLNVNDPLDSDTGDQLIRFGDGSSRVIPGGNRVQNYPVLSSAIIDNGKVSIQGRLDSAPNTTFQIDFYANEQMDPTGFGEGKYYIGTVPVTTDTVGRVNFTAVFDLSLSGIRFITATATDPDNNTSEFSARTTVGETLGQLFIVNTTDDHDDGVADALDTTLREAIHAANNHPGNDTIRFNIPGSGVRTLVLAEVLPPIMDAVTIDGYSQPGARANSLAVGFDGVLLIQVTTVNSVKGFIASGLIVSGGNSTIRGLIINHIGSGIHVVGAGNNVIEGNIIGLDASGTTNVSFDGSSFGASLTVTHSSNNQIGGGTPAARNLLVNVQLNAGADNNRVQGNYIGMNASGQSKMIGDVGHLFIDRSSNNRIGGSAAAERNVLFGTVFISGAPFAGGPIDLSGFTAARSNQLLGNYIGVAADGRNPLGFTGTAVGLSGAVTGTTIGGIEPGAGNIIAGNMTGVSLRSTNDINTNLPIEPVGNAIRGNSIHRNSALGIDLDGDIYQFAEVTRNDNNDLAVGPNHLQNFPVLSSAISSNGGITIQGRLKSTPNRTFLIDFYANEQMDLSGYGEGQTYIGTTKTKTDETGLALFSLTLPVSIPNGRFITATATSPSNDTSEFSARITVGDVLGSVFVVNTTDDHDDGIANAVDTTLREAMQAANNHPGHDTILFNIPGNGVRTISPRSGLPPISDEVTIDGYSQPGASVNTLTEGNNAVLLIEIRGNNQLLDVRAGNTTIRGLVINSGGIFITENGGNVVQGNFLGTDPTGMQFSGGQLTIFSSSGNLVGGTTPEARNVIVGAIDVLGGTGPAILPDRATFYATSGNLFQGNFIGTDKNGLAALNTRALNVQGAFNNTIGGTTPQARNVIAGGVSLGAHGVTSTPANNMLLGNFIGTDRTGRVALGGIGVTLFGVGNIVGGTVPGAGNLISGSQSYGIVVGANGSGHTIQGNRIGTDVDGTSALGNQRAGIGVNGNANLIGGTEPGAGNLISGNGGGGIEMSGFLTFANGFQVNHPTTGNVIQGNFIGTQADGVSPLPNLADGILVSPNVGNVSVVGAVNNTIGGTASGAGNVIAFNAGNGINLNGGTAGTGTAGSQIAILSNSIYANGKLGIDLKGNGPTANDANDFDFGDNNLQNFPVLTTIANTGSSVTISGSLNSAPSATYRLEFFDNIAFDVSGSGEGGRFIGTTNVTTDTNGNVSFSVTFAVTVPPTHVITATATDAAGNTSEFSQRPVGGSFGETANLSVTLGDAPDPIFAGQLLTYSITVANDGPDTATNIILFDTLPAGVSFQPGAPNVLGLAGNNTVLATIANLASGASATVLIQVIPTATGVLSNTVTVSADQFDPDANNNTASVTTTIEPSADLIVTKSSNAQGPVAVGTLVQFIITVTNRGPSSASTVAVTDTFPDGLTFGSFSGGVVGTRTESVLSWDLGTMSPGATSTFSYIARPNAAGTFTNGARVASSTEDLDPTNNASAVEIVAVPAADLTLTQLVSSGLGRLGTALTYTFTIRNNGPSDSVGVRLTDVLPGSVTFDSASVSQGNFALANGSLSFELGLLPSGGDATATVVVIPTRSEVTITNVGAVVSNETVDPNPLNNEARQSTFVFPSIFPAGLYGVSHISAGSSVLYSLDPLTGAGAEIGPIGFNRVSGIDFDPKTGILYGTGRDPATDAQVLLTIDINTGVGTKIGPLNMDRNSTDISFRNSDSALLAYLNRQVAEIDIATGSATLIDGTTTTGRAGNGLAFSANGTLYRADNVSLDRIDIEAGAVTTLFELGFTPPADSFPRMNALDFEPSIDILFGSLNDANGDETYLSIVDISTGIVSIIGATVDGLDAIAFVPTRANQTPVNHVPGAMSTGQTPITLSVANGNALSVTDIDAGNAVNFLVTLRVGDGTLSLLSSTGLIVTGSGTPATPLTVTGTLVDINAALGAGLQFTPPTGFQGTTTLTITSDDKGNTGAGGPRTDSDTFEITVTAPARPPRVTAVIVDSSAWAGAFRDFADGGFLDPSASGYRIIHGSRQLETLPWINIDRIKISFSEDVGASLGVGDFQLTAAPGFTAMGIPMQDAPTIVDVTYDPSTRTAILVLNKALPAAVVDLGVSAAGVFSASLTNLDGEWINGTSIGVSGDGVPGGNFSFRIFVVPGDVLDESHGTGTRSVNSNDAQIVRDRQNGFALPGIGAFGYDARADLDGSSFINTNDSQYERDQQNAIIVENLPQLISVRPLQAVTTSREALLLSSVSSRPRTKTTSQIANVRPNTAQLPPRRPVVATGPRPVPHPAIVDFLLAGDFVRSPAKPAGQVASRKDGADFAQTTAGHSRRDKMSRRWQKQLDSVMALRHNGDLSDEGAFRFRRRFFPRLHE